MKRRKIMMRRREKQGSYLNCWWVPNGRKASVKKRNWSSSRMSSEWTRTIQLNKAAQTTKMMMNLKTSTTTTTTMVTKMMMKTTTKVKRKEEEGLSSREAENLRRRTEGNCLSPEVLSDDKRKRRGKRRRGCNETKKGNMAS